MLKSEGATQGWHFAQGLKLFEVALLNDLHVPTWWNTPAPAQTNTSGGSRNEGFKFCSCHHPAQKPMRTMMIFMRLKLTTNSNITIAVVTVSLEHKCS